jgi:hypothetical protein
MERAPRATRARREPPRQVVPAEAEPSPALMELFLKNQAEEIAIRREELELRRREMDANFRYADHALTVQADDLRDARAHRRQHRRDLWATALTVLLILFGFFGWCLWIGKDGFASELLKAVLYAGTGGAGGFFVGKERAQRARSETAAAQA